MLPFFDRRKQRLEKLAAAISAADDRALAAVLARVSAAEVAVALATLPLERANVVVAGVAQAVLQEALALADAGQGIDEKAAGRFVAELRQEQPAPPEVDPHAASGAAGERPDPPPTPPGTSLSAATASADGSSAPMCVKALDLAGRMLGTFAIESTESGES